MLLQQGKTYKAQISLGFFEAMASNAQIAAKFREVGFQDVVVTGGGATRQATGRWPSVSREVQLPSQVKSATLVG
jgi:hypothetical protein